MNVGLEIFLLSSLVIKTAFKSSKRFRLIRRKGYMFSIRYPIPRDPVMLLMPETSIAGFALNGKPLFLHRFSMVDVGDRILSPVLPCRHRLAIRVPENNNPPTKWIEASISCSNWGGKYLPAVFGIGQEEQPVSLLALDYTIEFIISSQVCFSSAATKLTLARIGETLVPILSEAPKEIIRASLYDWIFHTRDQMHTASTAAFCEGVAKTIGQCLRHFQLDLDNQNKYIFVRASQTGDDRNLLIGRLLESRIQKVEAWLEFAKGPLRSIIEITDPKHTIVCWILSLQDKLKHLRNLFQRNHNERLDIEEIFGWELCALEHSSASGWVSWFRQLPDEEVAELLSDIQTFARVFYSEGMGKINIPEADRSRFGLELAKQIDRYHDSLCLVTSTNPEYKSVVTLFLGESPLPKGFEYSSLPLILDFNIPSFANSFILPETCKQDPYSIEVARKDSLLKVQYESQAASLGIEILTHCDPILSRSGHKFTLSEPGIWKFHTFITWPDLGEEVVVPGFDCFAADFTVDRVLLLCRNEKKVFILMMEPFLPDSHEHQVWLSVKNPIDGPSAGDFAAQISRFYHQLHEPHRSETFTIFEKQQSLLWAVLVIAGTLPADGFVECTLVLSAFSIDNRSLRLQTQFIAPSEKQWLCIPTGISGKVAMDLRHNQSLSFYFSWREAADRIVGVWLKSHGYYAIYVKHRTRFELCCHRRFGSFTDYFLTELLPTAPGLVGVSPILLRKNQTIDLEFDSCSYETIELRLKLC